MTRTQLHVSDVCNQFTKVWFPLQLAHYSPHCTPGKKHFQICEKLNQSSYHCNVSVFGVLFQPNLDIAQGFKLLNSSIFNILYLKTIYDFPKMRGGQRSYGTFPKIHPFWRHHLSLWSANQNNCTSKIIILRRRRYIKLFL